MLGAKKLTTVKYTMNHESFVDALKPLINNEGIDDATFRAMVRGLLPTVAKDKYTCGRCGMLVDHEYAQCSCFYY